MPIRRTFPIALGAVLLAPALSLAAELGRISIVSGVGEPLRAEIEVVSVAPNEAQSLAARIPPPDAFWRANIEPAPALRSIRASVERRAQGRYVVTLRSSEPMLEPFMDLLVEISSNAGRSMREYTFLLEDAPVRRPSSAPIASPAPHAPAPPAVEPPAVEPRGVAGAIGTSDRPPGPGGNEYRVKPGDTLGGIARDYAPYGVTLDQMAVAIYQANQEAFFDRNMNLLKQGRVLAIPDEVTALGTDAADARRTVLEHRSAFDQHRNRLAAAVAAAPAPPAQSPSQQAAGRVTAPGTAEPAEKAAPDQLTLSQPSAAKPGADSPSAARDDDIIAMQRALTEAQERITLLEKNLQDVRQLLDLKNQQLTRLQNPAQQSGSGGGAAELPANGAADAAINARESSLSRTIARALAWMSVGAAVVLLPIGGLAWLRSRQERRRDDMLRQATGGHRHKRRHHRSERLARSDEDEAASPPA